MLDCNMQRDYASVSIMQLAREVIGREGLLRKCGARAKPILHIRGAWPIWNNWIPQQFRCESVFAWVGRRYSPALDRLIGVEYLDPTPIGEIFHYQPGDTRQSHRIIQRHQ